MAGKPRMKNRDNAKRAKKKVSVLAAEKVEYIDYKDVNLLRRFMSDRAKIRARRVTGNDSQQQREVARAIKNAREMALVPYTNRITTQRGGRRDDRRGGPGRGPRRDEDQRPPKTEGAEGAEATETEAVDTSELPEGVTVTPAPESAPAAAAQSAPTPSGDQP